MTNNAGREQNHIINLFSNMAVHLQLVRIPIDMAMDHQTLVDS